MGGRRGGRAAILAGALAAAAPAAGAGEDLDSLVAEETRRADELMILLHDHPGDPEVLAAATALRERCLRSGNHRSAEFVAGPLSLARPESLEDRHRYVDILVVRGKRAEAERELRSLVRDRPSDCTAHSFLADLLLGAGDGAGAREAHAAHLREHAREAGPLRARAAIALLDMRDPALCRESVAEMRAAAADPSTPPATAEWLAENAGILEGEAAAAERDGEALRARASSLDGWLAAAFAAGLLALAGAFRLSRPRR